LENLKRWLRHSPACILSDPETSSHPTSKATDLQKLELQLQSASLNPEFSGWTTEDSSEKQALAILAGGEHSRNYPEKAPRDFKVAAIMTAYNEEDIVVPSLQRLIDQGILIYFIDNWSTDSTYDLAKPFEGKGIIGHERFPEQETKEYNWGALLTRVEELAGQISADWFIHHDIDEVRLPPWPGINLKDGIYRVDRAGFNCIDHTVIEFHPVDNDFVPGSSFEKHFRHFEFSRQSGHFLQIKAWKNLGLSVSLAASGGHDAQFAGQRVYPYKFLLKHYPIRSQKHGERKVFYDRKLRWNARERAAGWHSHYDPIQPGHVFLRSPSELEIYDEETFYKRYVLERLSGVGVNRKRRR
jgi:glycosyltransferase involved in cell wall biosynthesis